MTVPKNEINLLINDSSSDHNNNRFSPLQSVPVPLKLSSIPLEAIITKLNATEIHWKLQVRDLRTSDSMKASLHLMKNYSHSVGRIQMPGVAASVLVYSTKPTIRLRDKQKLSATCMCDE